jgi:lantibiotic transport system permease protein
MIKALSMEFYKSRRRKIVLVALGLLAVQLVWILWGTRGMDARELETGWLYFLFQMPLLNSIMLPVVVAVISSRLCDVEHKGHTFNVLKTILPAGKLFDIKLIVSSLIVAIIIGLQVVMLLIAGIYFGFTGPIPFGKLVIYLFVSLLINMGILGFQQTLSLLFQNQMIALTVGLFGSFVGLFSLFFPEGVQKFYIWGYFGILMQVGMNWDPQTRIMDLFYTPLEWQSFLLLAIHLFAIYFVGRFLFVRKEI